MDKTKPSGQATGISRRTFLHGLGVLALSACGGGSDSDAASSQSPNVLQATIKPNGLMLAQSATGEAATTTSGPFVHPGLLHTQADFDRMAQKVAAQVQPWYAGFQALTANGHTRLSWSPRPATQVNRGGTGPQNYPQLYGDIAAAYACALYWKTTGDTAYADKAVQIMNAWSSTLQLLAGDTNVALAAGIYGYEFAIVGEIMRSYPGLTPANLAAFQKMMANIFYPISIDFLNRHNNTDYTHYWANWDLCNMASIMAIGVLTDDHGMFDTAVNYYLSGLGNGAIAQAVYYVHPGNLGQWQESGRDQGHNTLGIALGGVICEMAWNQGIDLYGHDNNRFLAGAEYVAKANLAQPDGTYLTVPYESYANVDVTQPGFSPASQGTIRPIWALVYNHYVKRKGLAAPWSQKFALAIQPEGGGGWYGTASGGYDQLGYGTLAFTRDPVTPAAAPSGVTAWPTAGQVVVSWWGVSDGTSYNVKRSATPSGPYATVASGIVDPLTYTDNPSPGTWYYVVSAITPNGESSNSSAVITITAPQLHTHLTFDESDGTSVADSSGHGHNSSLIGGASRVPGKLGNAVLLDGKSAHVSLPAKIVEDVSDFTIATWVFRNGSASKRWERVFDFGAGTGRYMMLTPCSGSGTVRFAISVNGYRNERQVSGVEPLPSGLWTHVAVTLSGKTLTLYVNGNQVNQATGVSFAPWRLGPTAQNWIGRSQFSNDPFFDGMIDDFRIYRGALPANEIAALAQT